MLCKTVEQTGALLHYLPHIKFKEHCITLPSFSISYDLFSNVETVETYFVSLKNTPRMECISIPTNHSLKVLKKMSS